MKIGILCAFLVTLFFTYPFLSYIDQPLGHRFLGQHGEIMLNYFVFGHNLSKFSNLDFSLSDARMFYPHQNTWFFGNTYLTQSILAMPVYLVTKDVILAVNSTIILNFLLSFLAMYLLAYYLSKNILGSLASGLIFAFNPFVWSHIGQLDLTALQWIPLIFLVAERLIKKVSFLTVILMVSLLLLQLGSSFYYAFFIMLLLPIYFLFRVYLEKIEIKKFFRKSVLIGFLVFIIVAFLYLKPFIDIRSIYEVKRPLSTLEKLSAYPSDFIFTAEENRLYGWMNKNSFFRSLRHPFARESQTEHSLFPGLGALILLSLSVYFFTKYGTLTKKPLIITYFVIFGLSLLLSFGPYIQVGKIQIPSIYLLIYKFVPFVDSLRVMSRFVVISFLSMAVIISLAWSIYFTRLKMVKNLALILVIFTILEYMHTFPIPDPISSEIRHFYSWLNNQSDIKVIIELPMANSWEKYPNLYRDFLADERYLLYGIYHTKKMVNGAQAIIPSDITSLGQSLTFNFPTRSKLELLKNRGVDTIIVHKEEYFDDVNRWEEVVGGLRRFDLKEAYTSENISAFSLD